MSVHVHNSDLVQMKVLPCRSEFHGEPRSKGRGPRLSARVLTSLQFQLYRLGSDRRWLCLSKRSHALRMRKFDSPTTTLRGILQPIVQDRLLETDSNSSRKSLSSPQLWSPGVGIEFRTRVGRCDDGLSTQMSSFRISSTPYISGLRCRQSS